MGDVLLSSEAAGAEREIAGRNMNAAAESVRAAPPASGYLGQDSRKVQRRAVIANMGVVAVATVTGGPVGAQIFQLYAAQVLGLSASEIGLALGLLVLSLPSSFVAASLARRVGHKRLLVGAYSATVVLLLPFFFLPRIFQASFVVGFVSLIVILVLKEAIFAGSWGAAWFSWMRLLSTPRDRGRFFARMRWTVQLFGIGLIVLFGAVVGSHITSGDFDVLLAVLVAYLLAAVALMATLPEPRPEPATAEQIELSNREGAPWRLREAASPRRLLGGLLVSRDAAYLSTINSLLLTTGPPLLFSVYAATVLKFSDREIARILIVQAIVTVAVLPLWGRLIDRAGCVFAVQLALAATVAVTPLWLLVERSGADQLSLVLVTCATALAAALANCAGITLRTWLGEVVDQETSLRSFASFNVLSYGTRYVFVAISGFVLSATARHSASLGFVHVDGYRALIVAGVVPGIAALALTRRVETSGRS
jgi:MFS family permease